MKNMLVGLAAMLTFCAPVKAQFTGNKLMERVEAEKRIEAGRATDIDHRNSAWLSGFVMGVGFTLDEVQSQVCLPPKASVAQLTKVLIQHLEASPSELHKPAEVLAIAAFRKAFPCRKP